MPRFVRPTESDYVEDPIHAMGTMLRARIIGYVRKHPGSQTKDIVAALEVPRPTAAKAINALRRLDVLRASPAEYVRGQPVFYTVNDDVISEMWMLLGHTIGEL